MKIYVRIGKFRFEKCRREDKIVYVSGDERTAEALWLAASNCDIRAHYDGKNCWVDEDAIWYIAAKLRESPIQEEEDQGKIKLKYWRKS